MRSFDIQCSEPPAGPPGIVEVRIGGFLDADSVADFEQTMQGLLERQYGKCIMDLEGLNYISSAGIGALMVLLQHLRGRQGDLILLHPSPKVYKILDLLGFTRIFQIVDDRVTALELLA